MNDTRIMFCKKHGETDFALRSNRWRCKKCMSESVQRRREKLKIKAIEYKGGECEICGYKGIPYVYDFHHIDPTQKDFSVGHAGYTRSFDSIKNEVDKCSLLCCRCHREVHSLYRKFPNKTFTDIVSILKNGHEDVLYNSYTNNSISINKTKTEQSIK